ncbi:PREDICTED: breast cancer type 2 susceptibility protein isoform X2 [Gavialis gangeticus]|uniref:breast cancer type 2 susceptibility protein isoform X2 n=1 Tax=Gavialis gangeticus TaxID=94835 RepID=UPI00092F5BEB|nr:PREDICTED: breast cancer type 2 susceptibility protein isoform X2 [Gavialis gangeticus]
MDKEMANKPVGRSTFFEIFKTQCSKSDLGPISLNWFEELSLEASPYESKMLDETEYRTGWLDPSTFKTPKGKLSVYSQLASTPMIFKEQSTTLRLLPSPVQDLGQKRIGAGKESLANKEHRTSPCIMKTKMDQANEIPVSPFDTCLNTRSSVLRSSFRTPQKSIVPVAYGSLFCSPKLLEVKTPKCISESLGAEVDPDMSWSSSLATPPTLGTTEIIAKENDSLSGSKEHDDRIAKVLHNFYNHTSPEKNGINMESTPEIVKLNAESDVKDCELEKMLDGSFGETSGFQDPSHIPDKAAVNSLAFNALKDGEKCEATEDMPNGEEDVLCVRLTSSKPGNLQKVKTDLRSKKKHLDKMKAAELQETDGVTGNFRDVRLRKCERELDFPRCKLFAADTSNSRMQMPSENQKFTNLHVPSSLTSEWSQLDLSGLDSELPVLSAEGKCLLSETEEKSVSSKYATKTDVANNSSTSSFNNGLVHHELKDVVKNKREEHRPVTSDMASTWRDYLVDASNTNAVPSIKHKVLVTACFFTTKYSKMDFGRTIPSPKKDVVDGNTNINLNVTVAPQQGPQCRQTSSDNDHLIEFELEPVSVTNCNCSNSLSEINLDKNNSNSIHCNRSTSTKVNDATNKLPIHECKGIINSPLKIQSYKNSSTVLKGGNKTDGGLFLKVTADNQETESAENDENKFQTAANKNIVGVESGNKVLDLTDLSSLPEVISEKSTLPLLQDVPAFSAQESVSTKAQKARLVLLSKKGPEPNAEDKHHIMKAVEFPLKCTASDNNINSITSLCFNKKAKENSENREKWLGHASFSAHSLKQRFDGFRTASNKQIKLSENSITRSKMLFKDIEDECLKDLSTDGIKSISNKVASKSKISSVLENKLDTNSSSSSDSQAGLAEFNNPHCILFKSMHSSFQNLPENQQQLPEQNRTLTASQEAEITELSNILEETGSQFEFTQFRNSVTQNNASELSVSVGTSEMINSKNISGVCKNSDSVDDFETEVKISDNFLSKCADTESKMVGNKKEDNFNLQKYNCEEVASNLHANENRMHCIPIFSIPVQETFSNLEGFCSAGGKKIHISNKALTRATKLFSDLDDGSEMLKFTEINTKSRCSNKCMSSNWNVSRCPTEEGNCCATSLKDTQVASEQTSQNNQKHMENKPKNDGENIHIIGSTEVNNLKDNAQYSVLEMGNSLPSSESHAQSLKILQQLPNQGDTQVKSNSQEGLSDLTCFGEAAKTEEMFTLNILDEIEQLDHNTKEQKISSGHKCLSQNFQTVTNISVSEALLDEAPHLLPEPYAEKELNNVFSILNRQMTNSISKEGTDTISVQKSTNMNQDETKMCFDHYQINIRQDRDFKIKDTMQNSVTGFHTASDKKITTADESLAEAKLFFAEENIFFENEHNGNFEDPEIQSLNEKKGNKTFVGDCELFMENTAKCIEEKLDLTDNPVSKKPGKDAFKLIVQSSSTEKTVRENLSLESNVLANLANEPEKYAEAFYSKRPIAVDFGNLDSEFYTESGKNVVSKVSLLETESFGERELENSSRKSDASKHTLLVSSTDQTTDTHVTQVSHTSIENPVHENAQSILTVKDDKNKCHDCFYKSLGNFSDSSFVKCHTKGADCENSNDMCHIINCVSENIPNTCREQPLTSLSSDKNNFISFKDTFHNKSWINPKNDLKLLGAENTLKISATKVESSVSKPLKDGPFVFSTAKGKTVTVSEDALKRVRQLFPENPDNPAKQNIKTKLEINQVDVTTDCLKTFENTNCPTFNNSVNVEKTEMDNVSTIHFPNANKNNHKDKQTLYQKRNASADLGSEPSSQSLSFQMKNKFSGIYKSPKKLNHPGDFPAGNLGFFSTASGKHVQLSEDSLKKARQLFFEMENNSLDEQQSILDMKCGYKVSSVGEKIGKGGTASASVLVNTELVKSQGKNPPNPELILSPPFGFSTASGKKVLVSENAFHKVTGILRDFDNIASTKCCYADHINSMQGSGSAIKTSVNYVGMAKAGVEIKNSRIQETCNKETDLPGISHETKPLENICNKPLGSPHSEEDKHLTLLKNAFMLKESCSSKNEHQRMGKNSKVVLCSTLTKPKQGVYLTCSQIPENYLETEVVESAKALMEDCDLTDYELQNSTKKSLLACRKMDKNFQLNMRMGKRRMAEQISVEPPIKRQLLPEFDRTKDPHKSLNASKSTPDGTIKDRRKFIYHVPLKPVTCSPFSATKVRQEVRNPNFTLPDQNFKGFISKSDTSSSSISSCFTPLSKTSAEKSEKTKNLDIQSKTAKFFVPPFKTKLDDLADEKLDNKTLDSLTNSNMNVDKEQKDALVQQNTGEGEAYQSDERDCTKHAAARNLGNDGADLTNMITNLHQARNLQEMRIGKKFRQNIQPQPGSLYIMKTSTVKRISLKAAVENNSLHIYSTEQLYMYGVSKHCIQVNSINAESFEFLIQDFFSEEYFLSGHGVQLADGGWLIPTDEGRAGKNEFYRALCDTPGVDPKLITDAWVYNHYRWIVWKLAAMEVSFPQEFASRCLTPERVLLQLKYRYDLEVDKSKRSAIKKIMERDDTAARTLVLCISKVISLSPNTSENPATKSRFKNNKDAAIIEVTDSWYSIKAVLDLPLKMLLQRRRLTVGQKIIVHGAELVGSQNACTPLEAPDTLMLKISANSTRRARWYAKLGFHQDPRPFPLSLSSLFSDGGTVGCIDIVIQRAYPLQWMEKKPTGSCVFRNNRAEEREAVKHAENQQKHLEALFAKIQAEYEQNEGKTRKRVLRSCALTRQQIQTLQDGAELYEAIQNSPDPGYMEGYLSEEQLRALNTHRQMLNDKKQTQIQAEFKKALESIEQEEHGYSIREVCTVWKLRVVDYRKQEKVKAVMLNIWRPLSDVFSQLKEGNRYRIYQLATSESKTKLDTANVQLTATKKTQYLQLLASQEILLEIYIPRNAVLFSRLLDLSFQPACGEVDLVGFVVSVNKSTGFTTLVYLSDENLNLVAIKIWMDLKQLAVEDIIKPCTLISASNIQWQSANFRLEIPTLFAGDLSLFSANPKEGCLQERFNELKNTIENVNSFCNDAKRKLMNLLQINGSQVTNLNKECGLSFLSPSQKSSLCVGNKNHTSFPNSEMKYQSPLSVSKPDVKLAPQGLAKMTPHTPNENHPKNCKKRKAMDLLSQIPPPPPLTPVYSVVSPSLKKAFQPPRSSDFQCSKLLKGTNHNSLHITALTRSNEITPLAETDLIADEELAMINTQALLCNLPKEKKTDYKEKTISAASRDSSDHLVRDNSPMSAAGTNASQNSTEGTEALEKDTSKTENLFTVPKKLQRRKKRKYY